jgi:hypothetical protein
VTYKSRGRPGNFKKSVHVTLNDPDTPKLTLTVKGFVRGLPRPTAQFSPINVAIGDLVVGEEKEVSFTLTNIGELGLTVTGIEAAGLQILPPFVADTIQPGDTVELRFLFVAKEAEVIQKYVVVETNDPQRSKAYLRVSGLVREEKVEPRNR